MGKPVLHIGSPRNHRGFAGLRAGTELGLEALHQGSRRIAVVTRLRLNTVNESSDEILPDLLHVDKHAGGQLHIVVAEVFNLRQQVLVVLQQSSGGLQLRDGNFQLGVEVGGLLGNVLHIVCQLVNRVLREPTDNRVNRCAQTRNGRHFRVPNDLTCELRHEVHKIAHVAGQTGELFVQSHQRRVEPVVQLVCHCDQTLHKENERRRQLHEQSRTKPDCQRQQTRRSDRSRTESRRDNADCNQQTSADTDCGGNSLTVVQHGFPSLSDFVQALADCPNLNDEQASGNAEFQQDSRANADVQRNGRAASAEGIRRQTDSRQDRRTDTDCRCHSSTVGNDRLPSDTNLFQPLAHQSDCAHNEQCRRRNFGDYDQTHTEVLCQRLELRGKPRVDGGVQIGGGRSDRLKSLPCRLSSVCTVFQSVQLLEGENEPASHHQRTCGYFHSVHARPIAGSDCFDEPLEVVHNQGCASDNQANAAELGVAGQQTQAAQEQAEILHKEQCIVPVHTVVHHVADSRDNTSQPGDNQHCPCHLDVAEQEERRTESFCKAAD